MLSGLYPRVEEKKNTYINYKCGKSSQNWGALTLDLNYLISHCEKKNTSLMDVEMNVVSDLEPIYCIDKNMYKEFYLFAKGILKEDDIIPL